ncbi:protein MAIN-LIKE 1-like [Arachis hypogaea]|uniref:protein MAIN-LIKE 1-like n=1 Tax=Arachis hypogaea TaxID=3818 RepID=UPI003B21575F
MPFGEYTVTLQDVAFQLGLPVNGKELFGELPPPNKVKQMIIYFTWFHERFMVLPADAMEDTVRIYACAYIMMLLSTQLIGDKRANRIHIRWLSFVANLNDMGSYSWGSAALA